MSELQQVLEVLNTLQREVSDLKAQATAPAAHTAQSSAPAAPMEDDEEDEQWGDEGGEPTTWVELMGTVDRVPQHPQAAALQALLQKLPPPCRPSQPPASRSPGMSGCRKHRHHENLR